MRKLTGLFRTSSLLLIFVISACNIGVAPPEGGPDAAGLEEGSASSTIIPIDLAGPTVGSSMFWYDGSTIVFVPGGEFIMGANGVDNPQRTVSLSPFWVYRSEVTNGQYQTCMSVGQCTSPRDPASAQALSAGDQREMPVTGVDWTQAQTYCEWAQGHLPTEAQWEKTARGTSGDRFPWGNADPACNLLNFSGCTGKLTKVGEYPEGRSFYEAFDMAGNALEWVQDWYDINYYNTGPLQDPSGPESGTTRVTRSSSFQSFPSDLELARRQYLQPDQFRNDLGFRCVVDDPQMFLPFCQTSPLAANAPGDGSGSGLPDGSCAPPVVEIGDAYCSQKGSYVNLFWDPNDITGWYVPGDLAADCKSAGTTEDGRDIITCGPGSGGGELEVCKICYGSSPPPEANCAVGFVKDPDGNCVLEFGSLSGESCPNGWVETSYGCAHFGQGAQPDCPAGSYWDGKAVACVSKSTPQQGEGGCLPGFILDVEMGCCTVPAGGQFPGCGPNAVVNENGFCAAADSTSNVEVCVKAPVTFGTCGGGANPPDGGSGCNLSCSFGEQPDPTCSFCVKP